MVFKESFKLESRHRAVSFHDITDQVKAIAQLHPDIINPEPSDIIGGGNGVSPMA